ncbi:MAG: amidase [bacterium]|nr:amidase [bacterium]
MTIQEAGELLRERKVSATELARQSLASIERLDGKLNAFLTVTRDRALGQARLMDEELARGDVRSPLHGIPVAVKDVFCTKGVRTTCGSALFEDNVPSHDAAVVERLEDAGAVLIGKTSMHELAYGITSNNPHFGAVHNPWDADCVPGGSSGGSGAAVAAGMVFMAMGTDTGGSIRIPASFCGTVGLKPTTGRISRRGVMPLDFTLDHMGPLTRTVRDAAFSLRVLAGHDPLDDSSSREPVPQYLSGGEMSLKGLRAGLPENHFFDRIDPEVKGAVQRMADLAANLGAEVTPIRLPDIPSINTIGRLILFAEAAAVLEPYMDQRDKFGADVLGLLDQGRLLTATDYINAQRLRRLAMEEFRSVWKRVDCLLTATTPIVAPKIGQDEVRFTDETEDVRLASTRLVRPFNVLGLPAISMPCGFHSSGPPMGLQIVSRPFAEDLVLRVAAALEENTDYHGRTPSECLGDNA